MARYALLKIVCTAGLVSAWGCSSEPEPRPLGADQFYRPSDRGGALPPGPRATPEAPAQATSLDQQQSAEALRVVALQVKPPVPAPVSGGSTQPAEPAAKPPVPFAPGQYISIGGVIAEVNGVPIYADDVVRAIAPKLSVRAKDLEESQFRSFAGEEISRQVDDMIRAEVAYVAADTNTSREDKQSAERLTEAWRDRAITANKGSIEEARRTFRDQGRSFEDASKDQYRLNLVRVYYSKKLFPRIQISAEDLRRYYEANKANQFSDRASATFRLIKISAKDMGSDTEAKAKIDDLYARAKRGETFEDLAGHNQDAQLLKNKGLVGPIDRGAYVLEDVENALWKLNPGEMTNIIKVSDAYYFARLESKKEGRTMAFEEDAVQKAMQEAIRAEQFGKMRSDMEARLRKESAVLKNPKMFQATLDMAMQNYARWRS